MHANKTCRERAKKIATNSQRNFAADAQTKVATKARKRRARAKRKTVSAEAQTIQVNPPAKLYTTKKQTNKVDCQLFFTS